MPKTRQLKLCLFCLFSLWLLFLPGIVCAAGQVNAFVYHRFGDSRYPSTNISLENFRSHLDILRQEDFAVLTLGEVVALLEQERPLPERCAVLTVDDAYHSFLAGAMPLLREFGFPATLFVNTDSVGGKEYLTWEALRSLQAEGIEIGNHSATHDYLVDRRSGETAADWKNRVTADLEKAQTALKKNLGARPNLFAYPYGEYSSELIGLVRKVGFRAACAQQSGVIAPGDDLFTLARFPMGGVFTKPDEFRQKLRLRQLPVEVLTSVDPVATENNPPQLRFRVDLQKVAPATLRCYVPGQENPVIEEVPGKPGVFAVQAIQPLKGRRSKYTLTGSDPSGKQWYWFSQLWVLPGF